MAGYNFKDEKDVQEYLKNLLIEYQFGCYGEKNPEVCHLLGDYQEAIKRDFGEAATLYKNNCDNFNYAKSCSKFGSWSGAGKGCVKDAMNAYNYSKKGCDLGDQIGCTNMGIMSIISKDVQKTDANNVINTGLNQLHSVCVEHKIDKACFFLAAVYRKGIQGIIPSNLQKAYEYSVKSCECGNASACANVAQMYARGIGVEIDLEKANIFQQKAIDLNVEAQKKQGVQFGQGIKTE